MFLINFLKSSNLFVIFVLLLVGEQVDRALHLSLAALLGNDIYNFGELVSQMNITKLVYIILNGMTVILLLY